MGGGGEEEGVGAGSTIGGCCYASVTVAVTFGT